MWRARRDLCARAVALLPTRRLRVWLSPGARSHGSTEFQVNSSNRFSAPAEAAHRTQPGDARLWQREARFRQATAEQSFVAAHASPRRSQNLNSSHHPHAPGAAEASPLPSPGADSLHTILNNYSARIQEGSPAHFHPTTAARRPAKDASEGCYQESKSFSCRKN